MQDFRRLVVWRSAMDLAAAIYELTGQLPREERFGLQAQMRSAAVSVASNIAEGAGRPTRRDMARFLGIAVGSICELECQLELAIGLGFLDPTDARGLSSRVDRLKRQLIKLYTQVSARPPPVTDESAS